MSKLSKLPTPDIAEHGAFFPSPFSLSQFTAPVSDLADFNYKKKYDGDKKILRSKKTDGGEDRPEKKFRKENGKKIRSGKKER